MDNGKSEPPPQIWLIFTHKNIQGGLHNPFSSKCAIQNSSGDIPPGTWLPRAVLKKCRY